MLLRTLVWMGVAVGMNVSVLAAAAPARPPRVTQADRCASYEQEFDRAIASGLAQQPSARAVSLRSRAEALCGTRRYASGIRQLEAAFKEIGVHVPRLPNE